MVSDPKMPSNAPRITKEGLLFPEETPKSSTEKKNKKKIINPKK
jgi:hypothetical protein